MNKGIRQHQEVLEALKTRAEREDAGYTMLTSQVPTSAALVEALMKPDYPTFVQKYTAPVISEILNPLVREVKGML